MRGQHLLEQLADRIGLLRLKWLKLLRDAHHAAPLAVDLLARGRPQRRALATVSGDGMSGPNFDRADVRTSPPTHREKNVSNHCKYCMSVSTLVTTATGRQ